MYIDGNNLKYFNKFGVEHIPKEIKKFTENQNIISNILRIQAYYLIMSGYFSIGFIDFVCRGKLMTDYTDILWRHNFKKNDEVILNYVLN